MKHLFLLFIASFCFACNGTSQNIINLSVADFEKQVIGTTIQLVDVRTSGEYESGHIGDAKLMDVNEDEFDTQIASLDKTKPVYVYCLSGGRSKTAAKTMIKQGFTQVYNLDGGIMAWRAEAKNLVINKPLANKSMTMEQYTALTTNDLPVLVEFYAPWCGPCKVLKPEVEKIKAANVGKMIVEFIDVDQHPNLANELKIKSIPALYYYEAGKKKWTIVGAPSKKTLYKKLKLKI
jgi:thioredoxin 1